ncbi:hypothetical protein ADK77_17890, partial [Streptomyces antibioticus]
MAAVGEAAAAAASRVAEVDGSGEGPCLSELDELIGQSAAAGMVVDLSVEGEVRSYAGGMGKRGNGGGQGGLRNFQKKGGGWWGRGRAGAGVGRRRRWRRWGRRLRRRLRGWPRWT